MKQLLLFLTFFGICIYAQAQSPYINKVYDFKPAPGQFVNDLPEYEQGDTQEDIIRKVEECILGDEKILISLGGYGGYVVFGFDHMVENKAGKYDFKIWGNAFYADANPNPDAPKEGGSCEPGIVMVSYDANGNNIPDDPWYELAGSEYHKAQTVKKYKLTYYKPDANKTPTPDNEYPFLNDTTYIKWKDNQGNSGYVSRNTFHSQSYYPLWLNNDSLVFEGTKLANNYVDESGVGNYYVQYAYRWGYADNHPNNKDRSNYDISWAIDDNGNPIELPGIHFVKVYTGVNQYCGWLGETSTEIMGAEDLHVQGINIDVPAYTEGVKINRSSIILGKEETAQLMARIFSSNPSLETVTWKSGDENLIIIDDNGLVTAISKGQSYIVAITSNTVYFDTCYITVTDDEIIPVESIILNQRSLSLEKGNTYQLSTTIFPDNATHKTNSWISLNNAIATVDDNGLITAISKGIVNVIVSSENGLVTDTCVVTITDKSVGLTTIESALEPKAYYANGKLHLLDMNGYSCSIFSINGQMKGSFHVHSTEETHDINLSSGIYILRVQKQKAFKTFKFIIL